MFAANYFLCLLFRLDGSRLLVFLLISFTHIVLYLVFLFLLLAIYDV